MSIRAQVPEKRINSKIRIITTRAAGWCGFTT
jgi:hypothetical protein